MRVALVHDYLIRFGGAEQVLLSLHRLFPEAPIFTLLYNKSKMGELFSKAEIHTSFLQKLPVFLRKRYKYFLPLLPVIPETFDLRDFDLVISSSSAFAKGIISRPKTIHICYCHNPMRFIWDYHYSYLKEQKFGFIKEFLAQLSSHYLRLWDRASSNRVDYFIANSQSTAGRISKYYGRQAEVIYPPVDITDNVSSISILSSAVGPFFLIVSQLTPYKKIDLAIEAFNKLELPLVIIGEGSERKRLERLAKANIKFLGFQPVEAVRQYYQNCQALIFSGEDDFGIAPVEAMSYGKPVLAFRRGGAIETVQEGVTGEFFDAPYPEILADGVRRLIENYKNYNPQIIRQRAAEFSRQEFEKKIMDFISLKLT